MKTLVITLALTIGTMGCQKPTETVCENLLAQQTGGETGSLEGTKWRFEYFAFTKDGKKIKKEEDITLGWIGFYGEGEMEGALCNLGGGSYETRGQNELTIHYFNDMTMKLCRPEENAETEQIREALVTSECYAIRDHELMIYYTGKGKANILVLSKY